MGNPFELEARPEVLEAFQDAWKVQVEKLSWAADTINSAANRVIGGEAWEGETAERYEAHRRKLVADLDDCAEQAGKVADALAECAQVLRSGQNSLDAERQKLAGQGIPYPAPASLPPEKQQVYRDVMAAVEDIRARVDEGLNAQKAVFDAAGQRLGESEGVWSSRTLKTLNYNIQQGGGGNSFFGDQGHQTDEMGSLAQRLVDGRIDVATLQEVFKEDAGKLEEELNKRAAPGERWEVRFGEASDKRRMDGWVLDKESFGNAVVVRTGNGVTAGDTTTHDLGDSGDERRSATETRINIR